ncbi:hypothetical protein ACHAQA_000688 [Verticillium albo-atrum]
MPPAAAAHRCNTCNKTFGTWKALQKHREIKYQEDGSHVHCAICGLTFGSVVVMVHHVKQAHGKEQDLKCPGCDAKFARAGSLMDHLEHDKCSKIPKSALDSHRAEKLVFAQELEKRGGPNFGTYIGRSTADDTSEWDRASVRVAAENQAPANKLSFTPDAFPSLPGEARPASQTQDRPRQHTGDEPTRPWGQQENLFPHAAAAKKPTTQQLAVATAPNAKTQYLMGIHDPANPHFDANKYFNDFNEHFDCPMKGCPQSFDSAADITRHLVTRGMHGNTRLQCPACLHFFVDVTAMTHHAESQSTRCNIRSSQKYRPFLDQLTAGVMDAVGQHSDTTIRYEVTNDAVIQYGKVNRQFYGAVGSESGPAQALQRTDYWATHDVKDAEW